MKPATLAELKKELKTRNPEEVLQICLRLGRFKKDNKELLSYLLFDAQDEQGYIETIKFEIDDLMEEINTSHIYYAKKGLQKIVRNLNKYIRYSGNKQTEVEVLIHFCEAVKDSTIDINKSSVIGNVYDRQVGKIHKALAKLHEDVQADYRQQISEL
jgi:Zn finger protein HypA/HybF involved in hydrogenase expression